MMGCFIFGVQAIMVHIVPHATELGISPASAASILTIIGAGSLTGRVIMGSVADRIGNKLALIICFILMVIALSWLVVAKELWMLYLFAVIFGFAYGALAALISPIVADLFGLREHGAILGIAVFIMTIGSATGPLMTGLIFDITGSYHLAFLVCVALSVVSLALISLITPTSKGGDEDNS